jgi:hypothetical protein
MIAWYWYVINLYYYSTRVFEFGLAIYSRAESNISR